jgi:hypothetical protein
VAADIAQQSVPCDVPSREIHTTVAAGHERATHSGSAL